MKYGQLESLKRKQCIHLKCVVSEEYWKYAGREFQITKYLWVIRNKSFVNIFNEGKSICWATYWDEFHKADCERVVKDRNSRGRSRTEYNGPNVGKLPSYKVIILRSMKVEMCIKLIKKIDNPAIDVECIVNKIMTRQW